VQLKAVGKQLDKVGLLKGPWVLLGKNQLMDLTMNSE
jgi:hypothetical protein